MAKFAFVYPGHNLDFSTTAPINIALLAAILEKSGVETIIIDEIAGHDLRARLEAFRPDVVGITATTTQFDDAVAASRVSREMGFFTVIGGRHVLVRPEEAMPHFDMVVQGEAEDVIVDIALARKRDKLLVCDPVGDLNDYPSPAWHLVDMDFYGAVRERIPQSFLNFSPAGSRVGSLLTSRGCPFDCIFCHNSWKGLKYRALSVERTVQEVRDLVNNHAIQSIFFLDDDFFFNRKRLIRICDLLIGSSTDIVWGCNARVTDVTEETLKKSKAAGCRQVTFGFESGSQRVLDVLHKKTTVEKGSRAVKLCKEAGLEVSGTFIIGTPTETLEDIELTMRFIRDHDIDSIGITMMTPFPGTRLWEWCEEHDFIPPGFRWSDLDYQKVPIRTNEQFTTEEIYQQFKRVRKLVSRKVARRKYLDKPLLSRLGWSSRHPVKTLKLFRYDMK